MRKRDGRLPLGAEMWRPGPGSELARPSVGMVVQSRPRPARQRGSNVSRARPFLIWPLGLMAVVASAPALGQNLDAGKSAAQIFSEVCANCHRSTREVRGASASFLREHYTIGSEMASSMATYLSSAAPERAPTPSQPKRTAAPAAAASAAPTPQATIGGRDAAAAVRGRPATAEAKPVAAPPPPAPTRPPLEEFEE